MFCWWPCQQLVRSEVAAPGVYSAGALFCTTQSSEMQHESCAMSFWTTAWNTVPSFMWHFFVQVSRHLYLYWIWPVVLRLKSCCVCVKVEMNDVVGEVLNSWLRVMVGKEAILTFRRDKAPLSFRPTHDWVACRSVPLSDFSFTLKHSEREDSSVQSGCPLPWVSCSMRKCLSANNIYKKNKTSHRCQPSDDDR